MSSELLLSLQSQLSRSPYKPLPMPVLASLQKMCWVSLVRLQRTGQYLKTCLRSQALKKTAVKQWMSVLRDWHNGKLKPLLLIRENKKVHLWNVSVMSPHGGMSLRWRNCSFWLFGLIFHRDGCRLVRPYWLLVCLYFSVNASNSYTQPTPLWKRPRADC